MEPSERALAEGEVEDIEDDIFAGSAVPILLVVETTVIVLEPAPETAFTFDAESEGLAPGMTMTEEESDIVIVPDNIGIRIVNVDDPAKPEFGGMDAKEMEVAVLWMGVFAVVPSP
jgi:hypothetical protein